MRVCYGALAWGRFVHDYRDSWEIVRRAAHERVGLTLDTFHIFSRNTELDSLLSIPGDRIFLVQVADAPRLSMDHLSWSRHYRCFPGQGELDLDQFVRHLHATGYDGPFSLEIFNDQFRSGSTAKTAVDGYRSLVYANRRTEAREQVQAEELAQAKPLEDVQFIEFAVNEAEKQRLTQLLGELGFVNAASHNRKAVELWRQGDVNMVMNLEPDSFATRYHEKHVVSVCAYGLTVEGAAALQKRAEDLSYRIVEANPDTDTHGIHAMVGLLYLIDDESRPAHWEREFQQHAEATPNAWLSKVDHIAISMSYEEMLQSVLLYRSVFGMSPAPSVDVSDPGGLVRSQVMQNPQHSVSFTLNSAQVPRN